MENIELISELITGRVKPHIYAFTTNTIPNYLKVGDTYRALTVRLNEWRKHFPNLQQVYSNPASIDDEIFFRDYAVHDFLIHEKGKYRLLIDDMVGFPPGTYYSKEFFKDTTKADVEEAIIDIQTSYKNNDNKYQFYNANTALPETYTYASTGYWTPRPNQQEAIDNFINAVDNGRTNLLMYAVMRFGKSFTAMCCAKAKNFKKVLVVSAKADVREEWKKTVQSADNFNQDYVFLSSEELLRDENIVSDTLASEKGIVLFLTLQDLQGTEIKIKHKSVFENELDLLIIDETHYGARAESYGRIIKTANTVKDITLTDSNGGNDDTAASSTTDIENQIQILRNKFKTYYSRILFFAYLTEKKVTSLSDIIDISTESDSKRIMKNLDIDINILKLMVSHMYPFILTALDYKIQNINALSHDESIPAMERAITAMGKFGKLSESEITTPISVATKMIELIPDEAFSSLARGNHHILDIASKMGEFAIVIFNRCTSLGIDINLYKDKILSVPTSSVAYEFTRKIYSILGMDISCIAEQFTSYDLLSIVDNTQNVDYAHIQKILSQNKCFADISLECAAEEVETLKFNAIVGNPPYQEDDGGAGASARPLYPYFVNMAKSFSSEYSTLIIPSKWYAGGKGLDEFRDSMLHDIKIRELHDCIHPEDIFPDTNNRGGICYLLWDDKYNNTESTNKIKIVTHEEAGKKYVDSRLLITRDLDIFIRNGKAISILDKVMPEDGTIKPLSDIISPRKPFGLEGNFVKDPGFHNSEDGLSTPIICYGKAKARGFIERSSVLSHAEWIDTWKVYMPYANNIGTELNDDNQNTFIGEPGSCCTETFLSVGHTLGLSETTAMNLSNYMRTKFARFLLSLAKISQHGTSKTYRFVPIVDFNEEWTDEKLYKKFGLSQEEINCIETSIKPMCVFR